MPVSIFRGASEEFLIAQHFVEVEVKVEVKV